MLAHVLPKRRLNFVGLHHVISQKIELFLTAVLRASNPALRQNPKWYGNIWNQTNGRYFDICFTENYFSLKFVFKNLDAVMPENHDDANAVNSRGGGFPFENGKHTSATVINHLKVISLLPFVTGSPIQLKRISFGNGSEQRPSIFLSLCEGTNFGNKLMRCPVLTRFEH
jgi:hypothetical protein